MPPRSRPRGRQVALVVLAVAGLTGISTATVEPVPAEREHIDESPRIPRPIWRDLRLPEQIVTAPSLALELRNLDATVATVHVHVSIDVGTTSPPLTLVRQSLTLSPGQTSTVPVGLGLVRRQSSLRTRAGGLRARIVACPGPASHTPCQTLSAADWFTHLDAGGSLHVYDESVLGDRYAWGDLLRQGRPAEPAADGDERAVPDRGAVWARPGDTLGTREDDGPSTPEVER